MITEKIYEAVFGLIMEAVHKHPGEMMTVPMGVVFSDGEVGYVTFSLQADIGHGVDLHLYTGEQGLRDFLQMCLRIDDGVCDLLGEDYRDMPDIAFLNLSLAAEASLTSRERKQCRTMFGGKPPVPESWLTFRPVLRAHEPLCLETPVQDPVQIRHLEEAATAAAWAAPKLREGKLPGGQELASCHQLLMLTPKKNTYRVKRVDLPQVQGMPYPLQELTEMQQSLAKRVRALPHRGSLEAALCDYPPEEALTEEGLPKPEYLNGVSLTCTLAVVWRGLGEGLYEPDQLTHKDMIRYCWRLLNRLSRLLLKEGVCPEEIRVGDARSQSFLAPWCAAAGVKLSRVRELPELKKAWSAEWDGDVDEEQGRLDDLRDPESFLTVLGKVLSLMEEEKSLPAPQREVTRHMQKLAADADEALRTAGPEGFAGLSDAKLLNLLLLALTGLLQDEHAALVCRIAAARGYDPERLLQMLDEGQESGGRTGKVVPFPGRKSEPEKQWEMSFEDLLHGMEDGGDGED